MDLVLSVLLLLNLANIGSQWFQRRIVGTRGVLNAVAMTAIVASAWAGDRSAVASYACLAVGVVLVISLLASTPRRSWRRVRLEVTLFGAAAFLLLILEGFARSIPSEVEVPLLSVAALLTGAGIVVSISRVMRHDRMT